MLLPLRGMVQLTEIPICVRVGVQGTCAACLEGSSTGRLADFYVAEREQALLPGVMPRVLVLLGCRSVCPCCHVE